MASRPGPSVRNRYAVPARHAPRPLAFACLAACALVCGPAWGHVAFDGIARGARFLAGDMVEIQWVDTIPHLTTAYHLSFIPMTDAEPVEIVSDLPPEQHSYVWQVPAEACDTCSLHVIQDNEGSDYSYTVPIVIVTDPADLVVEEVDMREEMGMHLPPDMAGAGAGGNAALGGAGGASWAGASTMGGAWTDTMVMGGGAASDVTGVGSMAGAATTDPLTAPMQDVAAQQANATMPVADGMAGAANGAAGAAMQWVAPSNPAAGGSCSYAPSRGPSPRTPLAFAGWLALGIGLVLRRPKKRRGGARNRPTSMPDDLD